MVLVGLGVSACANDDDSESSTETAAAVTVAPSAEGRQSLDEPASGDDNESAGGSAASPTLGSPSRPTTQALATTAGVTVATPNIREAVDDTLVVAQRNGASVFTADVSIGETRDDGSVDGTGYFVLKVPPAALEPLLDDLDATVGRLTGRTQDTTDVTDQLVDLDIRIGVERDVISRFQRLLVDATEFQDIVEIERVISERTIALEQLLASQRNLENRVDLSTLTIQLQYEPVIAVQPDDDPIDGIGDAWRAGWDVFVGALFAIGFVLAVAAPFIIAAALVLGIVWLAARRSRRAVSGQLPVPADPGAADSLVTTVIQSLAADEATTRAAGDPDSTAPTSHR